MLRLIRDEIREIDSSPQALRSFGLTVGAVLLVIAIVVVWRSGWTPASASYALGGAGAALIILGVAFPRILKPVHLGWMTLALVLGFIMTRVVLTAVFYLAVMPTGLVLRLLGKDPLHRRIDPEASTYWIPKAYDDPSPSRLEKYY